MVLFRLAVEIGFGSDVGSAPHPLSVESMSVFGIEICDGAASLVVVVGGVIEWRLLCFDLSLFLYTVFF